MRISVGYVRFRGIYVRIQEFYVRFIYIVPAHSKNLFGNLMALFAFISKNLYDVMYIKFIGIKGIERCDVYDIFKRENKTIFS